MPKINIKQPFTLISRPDAPCSEEQYNYIEILLNDVGLKKEWVHLEVGRKCGISELTRKEAYAVIRRLRQIKYETP